MCQEGCVGMWRVDMCTKGGGSWRAWHRVTWSSVMTGSPTNSSHPGLPDDAQRWWRIVNGSVRNEDECAEDEYTWGASTGSLDIVFWALLMGPLSWLCGFQLWVATNLSLCCGFTGYHLLSHTVWSLVSVLWLPIMIFHNDLLVWSCGFQL